MGKKNSFRFLNEDLNHQLLVFLKKAKVKHEVGKDGVNHYSPEDEEVVENELISPIRDKPFSSWQVLTCPGDWTSRYKEYMSEHRIPYLEKVSNRDLWFLLPRKYRPHRWKVIAPRKVERLAM
jgi:hypothetical protein